MAIDRLHIGVHSEPRTIRVDAWHLKSFAKATGEPDPVYFDESAARRAGHPTIPALPTFVHALTLAAPSIAGNMFSDIGVDILRALHGEQWFKYFRRIYGGDLVTLTTMTVDIYSKKNGALDFIVQDTKAHNQSGELCVEQRGILVVRNP